MPHIRCCGLTSEKQDNLNSFIRYFCLISFRYEAKFIADLSNFQLLIDVCQTCLSASDYFLKLLFPFRLVNTSKNERKLIVSKVICSTLLDIVNMNN